jgi:hypothetical protein
MENKEILILILIVLIGYKLLSHLKSNKVESYDPLTKQQTGPRKIQDDKVFADVKIYENDNDEGWGRIGLDKCLEYCNGVCVEYGVTGVAHCFPSQNSVKRNYYTTLRDTEYETEEVDRAGTKIKFPNLR